LIEPVELEVAVIVARRFRQERPALHQPNARALDAIDGTIRLCGERTADEAFRIAPQIAIVDARPRAQFGLHHFEALLARHARHLRVLDLDRAHGAGRARLLAAGLLPAAVEEMGVERPELRQLELLVPPDVPVRARVDEILVSLGLARIDDDDAVGALLYGADLVRLYAGRVVAVVAHGRNVGDVDHRRLPAL